MLRWPANSVSPSGTLDRIERDLVELNQQVDNQLLDHGRVLANHNERLAALEPQQRF